MKRVFGASMPFVLLACGATRTGGATEVQVAPARGGVAAEATKEPARRVPPVAKVRATYEEVCALANRRLACATIEDPTLRLREKDVVDFDDSLRHRCIVLASGRVRCTGSNSWGELGARMAEPSVDTWVDVHGVDGAVRVALAEGASCALTGKGDVLCWGRNASGQTGGADDYAPELRDWVVPTRVPLPAPMTGIAVATGRACAHDGMRVFCWGLGKQPHPVQAPPPDVVIGLESRIFVTGKDGAVVALDEEQSVIEQRPLELLRGAVELVEGGQRLCGVTRDGKLLCDGDRRRYEDDPKNGPFVQSLASIPRKASIAIRNGMTFVLSADHTLFVFGDAPHAGALGRLSASSDGPVPLGNVNDAPP